MLLLQDHHTIDNRKRPNVSQKVIPSSFACVQMTLVNDIEDSKSGSFVKKSWVVALDIRLPPASILAPSRNVHPEANAGRLTKRPLVVR
jgi:hypothetical protein